MLRVDGKVASNTRSKEFKKRYPVNLRDDLLEEAVKIITSNDEHAEAIYLFGSYARGEEHAGSDVDLYVVTGGLPPFLPDEGRKCAQKEFAQLIADHGLPNSVLSFGPAKEFPIRIRSVAFEEYSVWHEGIMLWASESYQRQAKGFYDGVELLNVYFDEIYDHIWSARRKRRSCKYVAEKSKLTQHEEQDYRMAIGATLVLAVTKMFDWVRELHGVVSPPKRRLSGKISECVAEGWIDPVPSKVKTSLRELNKFRENENGVIPAEEDPSGALSIDESIKYADIVAEFLRNNGYQVPKPGDYIKQ